jgi:RHS repeat-associated protein
MTMLTQYDAAEDGDIVNQVLRKFNGFGQLTREYQSHSGAVDTGSTPFVAYAYPSPRCAGAGSRRGRSPMYVDALILRERDSDHDETLDERLWAITDANWNVTALVSSFYGVVERYGYDPYGLRTDFDDSWESRSSSVYDMAIGFQGKRWDSAAKQYESRYRWYDPKLMVWTSVDPIRFVAGDVNLFRFVGNNPNNGLDPSGLAAVAGILKCLAYEQLAVGFIGLLRLANQQLAGSAGHIDVGISMGVAFGVKIDTTPGKPFIPGPWAFVPRIHPYAGVGVGGPKVAVYDTLPTPGYKTTLGVGGFTAQTTPPGAVTIGGVPIPIFNPFAAGPGVLGVGTGLGLFEASTIHVW